MIIIQMICQIIYIIQKFSTKLTNIYETLIEYHSDVFSVISTHDVAEDNQDILEAELDEVDAECDVCF